MNFDFAKEERKGAQNLMNSCFFQAQRIHPKENESARSERRPFMFVTPEAVSFLTWFVAPKKHEVISLS